MLPEGIPKLSKKERIILEMLLGAEMYGLEIVEASNREIGRGSVYVFLDRLEEKGFVESRLEDRPPNMAGNPRRLYRPTGAGVRVIRWIQDWEEFRRGQLVGART